MKKINLIQLDRKDLNLINGKDFFRASLFKILYYIFENEKNMSQKNIYIFVNEYNDKNVFIIEKLSTLFKTVNVITGNLRKYGVLEEKLYNKGYIITISNNKRKSAKKAQYIINVDFNKEDFEKYNIYRKSIIINLTNENSFFDSKFNGVIINNFDVKCNENFDQIDEIYDRYNLQITDLIGVRGVIQKCEFLSKTIDKIQKLI